MGADLGSVAFLGLVLGGLAVLVWLSWKARGVEVAEKEKRIADLERANEVQREALEYEKRKAEERRLEKERLDAVDRSGADARRLERLLGGGGDASGNEAGPA